MIYFAMNGKWTSQTKGSWTAISRVPWLKAVVLFAKGDCWNGGGLFTAKRRYWLNEGHAEHALMTPSTSVERQVGYRPDAYYGGECPGVYYLRLRRDRWIYVRQEVVDSYHSRTIFEKRLPKGWILRKTAHEESGAPPGKGCYWDEHELVQPKLAASLPLPDWEWADLDGRTLVWTERGRLYRAPLDAEEGVGEPVLLKDFNDMEFKAIKAPY